MVILRQERIFSYTGKGKFSECWMIIIYDTTGPSIQLFKDMTAKKAIFEKLHIPSMASQIRFGTTCRPYGNLPVSKPDPKIDGACMIVLQVERRVKKEIKSQLLWLCAESTKQMFGIMKILACGLTIMSFPAPAKNLNPEDINALHHYRPRIIQPTNAWEEFFDNPPDAKIVSPRELTQQIARSMDALNVAVAQQQEIQTPAEIVVKSKSTPDLEALAPARRHSVVSHGSSFTSSRSSTSRSLSGRRRTSRSVRVWELKYFRDMPKIPYSPQKTRKYERQESARSSPVVIRQRERQHKKPAPEPPFEEEPIYIKHRNMDATMQPYEAYYHQDIQPVKSVQPSTPPPLISQPLQYSPQKHVYDEVPDYDRTLEEEAHKDDCQVWHPAPTHHHHSHKHHQHTPHRRYSQSVERPHQHSPPQSILKRQPTPKQRTVDDEVQQPIRRPVSGYSSSAYGSGHVTPSHLNQPPQKKEFEVELLRRMSDLSLRPLSRTMFTSPPTSHYEKPIAQHIQSVHKHKPHHHHIYDTCHSPVHTEQPLIEYMPIEEPAYEPVKQLIKQPKQHIVYDPVQYKHVEEQPKHHHIVYEPYHSPVHSPAHSPAHSPIHSPAHSPIHTEQSLIEYEPVYELVDQLVKQPNLLEQSSAPLPQSRISDPEYLIKPKVKRRSKPHPTFISQGVQTDHDLPNPPVPLIENFEFAQTKRFTFEAHEPHLHHYRKLSHQSSRSIYIQRLEDTNDYETVRPFFRTDSSSCASECPQDEYISPQPVTKRHSNALLVNNSQGTRTYTVDVDNAAGLL